MRHRTVKLGRNRAPALLSFPEGTAPRGIMLVLPGGGIAFDKRWAARWLPLEELPVLRAYVDLPLHGERLAEDFRQRHRHDRLKGFFTPAVAGMAAELPSILDDLLELAGTPSAPPIGACGWSIGALGIFLGALREERLRVLAGFGIPGGGVQYLRLEGMPEDEEGLALAEELDLLPKAAALYPRPVLLMHGAEDTWVSAASSRSVYETLRPSYVGMPDRLRYVEYPRVPHNPLDCDEDDRQSITDAVRDWFRHFLLEDFGPAFGRHPVPGHR